MYQLPNRKYYAQLADIDEGQLLQTLHNVLLYCVLQFTSLLAVMLMLHTELGLSPLRQLAFVLEKQFAGAQIKLVFWVFYNVQASLQHYGKYVFIPYILSFVLQYAPPHTVFILYLPLRRRL